MLDLIFTVQLQVDEGKTLTERGLGVLYRNFDSSVEKPSELAQNTGSKPKAAFGLDPIRWTG